MAQRSVLCNCGSEFLVPATPPALLHCPKCGQRVNFDRPETGPVRVREDLHEPTRPVRPTPPYYPLVLFAGAGLLLAVGLIALAGVFSGRERPAPVSVDEGRRAKPRVGVEEAPISIRAIPVPVESKARQLAGHSNLAGLVATVLRLTGKDDEARDVLSRIVADHQAMQGLAEPQDCFQPGDELTGFGTLVFDPAKPQAFAEGIRSWLEGARPGAESLATVRRGNATVILGMMFTELEPTLLRRIIR